MADQIELRGADLVHRILHDMSEQEFADRIYDLQQKRLDIDRQIDLHLSALRTKAFATKGTPR